MKQEFKAVIQQHADMNAAYIEPPFDVEEVFGSKRVKVLATFDGLEYRGSLVRMGGCYMLGMTQEIRKKIGKDFGDTIDVTIEKDEEERNVDTPSDLHPRACNARSLAAFRRRPGTRTYPRSW